MHFDSPAIPCVESAKTVSVVLPAGLDQVTTIGQLGSLH